MLMINIKMLPWLVINTHTPRGGHRVQASVGWLERMAQPTNDDLASETEVSLCRERCKTSSLLWAAWSLEELGRLLAG